MVTPQRFLRSLIARLQPPAARKCTIPDYDTFRSPDGTRRLSLLARDTLESKGFDLAQPMIWGWDPAARCFHFCQEEPGT